MKTMWMLLGMLVSSNVIAAEGWFCEQESSERRDGAIAVCGVGTGKDEATARADAFDHAQAEFDKICEGSTDCKGHAKSTSPKRTGCAKDGDQHKCYRLIIYAIGAPVAQPAVNSAPDFIPDSEFVPDAAPTEVAAIEAPEVITLPVFAVYRPAK